MKAKRNRVSGFFSTPTSRELARFQLQGKGNIESVCKFLHALNNLGYPLAIDSVSFVTARERPGMVDLKVNVAVTNIVIWKGPEEGDA